MANKEYIQYEWHIDQLVANLLPNYIEYKWHMDPNIDKSLLLLLFDLFKCFDNPLT